MSTDLHHAAGNSRASGRDRAMNEADPGTAVAAGAWACNTHGGPIGGECAPDTGHLQAAVDRANLRTAAAIEASDAAVPLPDPAAVLAPRTPPVPATLVGPGRVPHVYRDRAAAAHRNGRRKARHRAKVEAKRQAMLRELKRAGQYVEPGDDQGGDT